MSQSLAMLLASAMVVYSVAGAAPRQTVSQEALQAVPGSAEICYDSESATLLCYREPKNTPQNVDVVDNPIKPAFFTKLAADTADCAEWGLYMHGTSQALAKHFDTNSNSSVLFGDIANTVDGGEASVATDQTHSAAITGCLADVGSLVTIGRRATATRGFS
ncbi:hypothetical protein SEUCBS139899_010680 [Sporothrix eucalyptigena]|uniref:Ecp2 effector protein domain-containing protein n=1 Tax=Sporothrix eucalyptigena TaxID=1812306 RepID=A0ABP0B998_9PEZI